MGPSAFRMHSSLSMKPLRQLILTLLSLHAVAVHAEVKPLKALLIAGGCCHDYAKQQELISKGIQSRANVQVDVIWTDDKSVNPPLPVYDKPNWADGYDIIIHDECAAGAKDPALVERILEVHKTVPAVHLHCAMHSFRIGNDRWFRHLGIQSASHGPQEPIEISYVDKEHPITKPLADWTTIKEELYNNVNVFDAHPLAMGKQVVKNKDGSTRVDNAIVAWTNEKQGARSFSTTIGHNNDTVGDARYLDLVTRGLLWACDKLTPEYLVPFKGENKVIFVPKPEEKPKEAAAPPAPPKDAVPIKTSASSEESDKGNLAWKAVDGNPDSRWCANGGTFPQSLQLELDKAYPLTGLAIQWESQNNAYRHKIEASADGQAWSVLADASQNAKGGNSEHTFAATSAKFLKITCLGTSQGGPGLQPTLVHEGGGHAAESLRWIRQGEDEPRTQRKPREARGPDRSRGVPHLRADQGWQTALAARELLAALRGRRRPRPCLGGLLRGLLRASGGPA